MEKKITILFGVPVLGRNGANKIEILAKTIGDCFAVHRPVYRTAEGKYAFSKKGWALTHVPSGTFLGNKIASSELAESMAGSLFSLPKLKWHESDPFEKVGEPHHSRLRGIIRELAKSTTVDQLWENNQKASAILEKA